MTDLTTKSRIQIHRLQPPQGEVDLEVGPLLAETNYPHHQAEPPRLPGNPPRGPEEAQEPGFPLEPHPERLTEP